VPRCGQDGPTSRRPHGLLARLCDFASA
jgi:hypothetical protein